MCVWPKEKEREREWSLFSLTRPIHDRANWKNDREKIERKKARPLLAEKNFFPYSGFFSGEEEIREQFEKESRLKETFILFWELQWNREKFPPNVQFPGSQKTIVVRSKDNPPFSLFDVLKCALR